MKLLVVDLEVPMPDIPPSAGGETWVLARLHGEPLGVLEAPRGGCTGDALARLSLQRFEWSILRHLTADGIGSPAGEELAHRIAAPCVRARYEPSAAITVAVCTRNRSDQLRECLAALARLDYPAHLLDLLVIDNAPSNDDTRRAVAEFPGIRYVREPRPGLDWARNRAVLHSSADIIAYTDDDVSVDPGWAKAVARAFEEEPDAACVTGLVLPDELDTPAQLMFERYGGFARGCERRTYRVDVEGGRLVMPHYGGTGRFGTGANMAFRRVFLQACGGFDPALDVGTVTNGGGDLEMFFRVLKGGHTLVYEPRALVRHRHRRELPALRTQIANNGIGFYSYLVRSARAWPDERWAALRLGLWWLWWWNLRRPLRTLVRPGAVPRAFMLAELRGSVVGLRRYHAARQRAAQIRLEHPMEPVLECRP